MWVDPLVLPEVVRDPFIGAWAHHRSGGARNNMGSHLEGGASASHGPGDGGSTSTRHELPELVSRVASGGGGGRAEIQGLASFTHTIPNLGRSTSCSSCLALFVFASFFPLPNSNVFVFVLAVQFQ